MLLDEVPSDLHHRVERTLQDLLRPITDELTRRFGHFLIICLDQLSQLRLEKMSVCRPTCKLCSEIECVRVCVCVYRVVLQVQVGQQRHVEDRLPPDAAVTICISQPGYGIQPATLTDDSTLKGRGVQIGGGVLDCPHVKACCTEQ